ncbi:uncharacterized protein LOC112559673 [Pomacea canaliculata]|uniref:uncharacterized protein LOC112559673 n=1 Tax=Pomacea canaliculata TaxID=400727 RepID=UPI000D729386|nr:uncharacterized protein LOC112559673 [Pomacea canaliculata]
MPGVASGEGGQSLTTAYFDADDGLSTTSAADDVDAFQPWNDPHNVISFQTYLLIVTVTNTVVYPSLFLVGFPTNVVSGVVFWKQGLKDRMNLCLFVLAVVDTAYLTVLMAQAASSFVTFVNDAIGSEYDAYSLVFCLGVGWGLKTASGCISMVVAGERCVCVALPLRADSLMKTRTMAAILVVIVVVTQVAYVIQPLAYIIVRVTDESAGDGVRWNIVTSDLFSRHQVLVNFLLVILLPCIVPLITFVVMVISTAITVDKLRTAMEWREQNCQVSHESSAGKATDRRKVQQVALTKMLVLLSCVHIVFTVPLMAVTFTRLVVPDFSPTAATPTSASPPTFWGLSSAPSTAVSTSSFIINGHRNFGR